MGALTYHIRPSNTFNVWPLAYVHAYLVADAYLRVKLLPPTDDPHNYVITASHLTSRKINYSISKRMNIPSQLDNNKKHSKFFYLLCNNGTNMFQLTNKNNKRLQERNIGRPKTRRPKVWRVRRKILADRIPQHEENECLTLQHEKRELNSCLLPPWIYFA